MYTAVVSEDVTPSWVIARLKATDADEYGSLRYELTGHGAKDFYIEPNSGRSLPDFLWYIKELLSNEVEDLYSVFLTML